jgi:hypothetical protein
MWWLRCLWCHSALDVQDDVYSKFRAEGLSVRAIEYYVTFDLTVSRAHFLAPQCCPEASTRLGLAAWRGATKSANSRI